MPKGNENLTNMQQCNGYIIKLTNDLKLLKEATERDMDASAKNQLMFQLGERIRSNSEKALESLAKIGV